MKLKTQYVCQSCGFSSAKWLGRCTGCEEWNSLVEEQQEVVSAKSTYRHSVTPQDAPSWVNLDQDNKDLKFMNRYKTGISELDRVLGGGLVPDSFVLLGGDPGIGKSTLLLQVAKGLTCQQESDLKVFYVSGEESVDQICSRAKRLGIEKSDRIFLAAQTQIETVISIIKEMKPNVLVIDSLQTFTCGQLESAPGSVSQVREVAARLLSLAKSQGIAVWLVGHVTKEGMIAGPKVVEHMVDTVLYFEGDSGQNYRLLRTVKNRFGSARELGVFEMSSEGLEEVKNPSSLFLNERSENFSGTAITSTIEGSRALLVELQSLVSDSSLAMPRRTSVGIDASRISLLAAVLERHMDFSLSQNDLFFNVAGGLKLSEPSCDLAAAVAIWSSFSNRVVSPHWVFMGELGLTGEVRRVSLPEVRIEEAKKLGFKGVVLPEKNLERCKKISGIELKAIQKISQLPTIIDEI